MKRRIKTAALSLIILVVAELAMTTNTLATTITISNNNDNTLVVDRDGQGDYKTIQEAINNAQSGFTIYVNEGEYCEIIEISKTISLVGGDKDSTLINPISEKNKYAVRLGAPGAKIQGFSIKNGAPGLYTNAVRITSPNTEIRDCNIYDTPVGIVVWTSDNIIENCNFWGCKDEGIALIGSSYSDCNNNRIMNCIFRNNCDGIELQYASSNTITNCEFYDNSHTGINAIAKSNDNNIISDCEIYNNEVHGIYFSSSSENKIIDCSVTNNDDGNIVMNRYSENNQIISNTEESSKDRKKRIINNFLSIISNMRIWKTISILNSIISDNF